MDQSIRILVVDDEPDIRRIIRILLEGRGYHVTEAPNGRLAVQAAKQDLWLHTQGIPGSHVIVVSGGREIPESTIYEAALLAAHHSKGKDSAQVPVDYCPVRFVKKPNGAKPGMVIFTNYQTVYVKPDEDILERCREGAHETAG